MVRASSVLLVGPALVAAFVAGSDLDPRGRLIPLEIPTADACPQSELLYYGATWEGDTFLWCIDRSCSMGWVGHLDVVKSDVIAALGTLSWNQRFTVITTDSPPQQSSAAPVPALPENVASATNWMLGISADGTAFLAASAVHGIGILGTEPGVRTMFIASDGAVSAPGFDETIALVTAANVEGIPIHAVYVGDYAPGAGFLADLAAANGGAFIDGVLEAAIVRGDADGSGMVTIGDAIRILEFGFGLDCTPICRDAADTTDDGIFEPISDAITLLAALFVPGYPPLAAPATCAPDPTPDGLACSVSVCP